MSYPNSVEEIDTGMLAEGFDVLPEAEQDFLLSVMRDERQAERRAKSGFGYWLDNCGDDEWYCKHCLQPECGKRKSYGW